MFNRNLDVFSVVVGIIIVLIIYSIYYFFIRQSFTAVGSTDKEIVKAITDAFTQFDADFKKIKSATNSDVMNAVDKLDILRVAINNTHVQFTIPPYDSPNWADKEVAEPKYREAVKFYQNAQKVLKDAQKAYRNALRVAQIKVNNAIKIEAQCKILNPQTTTTTIKKNAALKTLNSLFPLKQGVTDQRCNDFISVTLLDIQNDTNSDLYKTQNALLVAQNVADIKNVHNEFYKRAYDISSWWNAHPKKKVIGGMNIPKKNVVGPAVYTADYVPPVSSGSV